MGKSRVTVKAATTIRSLCEPRFEFYCEEEGRAAREMSLFDRRDLLAFSCHRTRASRR